MPSTAKFKLLFVVNTLKRRGAEQQMFDFISSLPDSVEVSIFRFSNDIEELVGLPTKPRIKIYAGKHSGTYNVFKFLPLYLCLSKYDFDVVVTIGLGSSLFFGRICSLLNKKKIVYSTLNTFVDFHNIPKFDGNYFDPLNSILNRIITLLPGKRSYRFLPNSKKLADHVEVKLNGYPTQPLYNGFSTEEFERYSFYKAGQRLNQIIRQIEGCPTVVQVGSLDENKNQFFTIQCVKDIIDVVPNIRILIIGDGPEKLNLEEWVSSNGVREHVVFTGQLSREESLYLVSKSNLLVLTSRSESFPNVLIEALAMSRPVVSLNVGAVSEIIDDGKSGFFVESDDQSGFINSVIKLLCNTELASRMGKYGKEKVFERFSMEKKISKFLMLIESDSLSTAKSAIGIN